MNCFEIENEEWEELIRYYYSLKTKMTKEEFTTKINEKDNLNIILNDNMPSIDSSISDMSDFKDFFDKEISGEVKLYGYTVENEWNYKICFIETVNYYVLRIWETAA